MRRIILILLLAICQIPLMAQYSVHTTTAGVKIKSGSSVKAASAGMPITGSDLLQIPAGGKIEILNKANKKIYASTTTGNVKVFDLVMDANKTANNHARAVGDHLRFGKKDGNSGTVFRETGMVRRSMAVYDPEGQAMEMDAAALGRKLAGMIAAGGTIQNETLPVKFSHSKNTGCGLFFDIENTLSYPVYFNIIRVCGTSGKDVEISKIGQPTGCYVLLPEQTMSRNHMPMVDAAEKHILVMAPCQYDIDLMMDEMKKSLESGQKAPESGELPAFACEL